MKKLLIADFPIAEAIFLTAQGLDREINKDNSAIWYLNLAARVCLSTLFVLCIIPAIFIDSVVKVVNIFNIKREQMMLIKDFVEAMPLGIKKIATAIAVAFVTIFMLNIAASSVSTILFGLKAIVGAAALLYSIGVVKENEENIWSFIETIKENAYEFAAACLDKVIGFFKSFTFGSKQETGGPVLAPSASEAEQQGTKFYDRLPDNPFAGLYDKLPGNPFAGLFSHNNVNFVEPGDVVPHVGVEQPRHNNHPA